MTLRDFVHTIAGFESWGYTERIKLFAWYLHVHGGVDRLQPGDIRKCFTDLDLAQPPSGINSYLRDLERAKSPQLLRDRRGHYLERSVRIEFDKQYGQRAITVQVLDTLRDLPNKLPNLAERAYLEEALRCFECDAFRASALMCWNVAYDHLCTHIITHRLVDFNAALANRFPKERPIANRFDFHELKESQVLEVGRMANVLSKNVGGVMQTHLDIRNRVAHASGVTFLQPQAEAFILDLINNAVLQL